MVGFTSGSALARRKGRSGGFDFAARCIKEPPATAARGLKIFERSFAGAGVVAAVPGGILKASHFLTMRPRTDATTPNHWQHSSRPVMGAATVFTLAASVFRDAGGVFTLAAGVFTAAGGRLHRCGKHLRVCRRHLHGCGRHLYVCGKRLHGCGRCLQGCGRHLHRCGKRLDDCGRSLHGCASRLKQCVSEEFQAELCCKPGLVPACAIG
jgi:hypothetical protein